MFNTRAYHERTVRVLKGGVGGQNRVVWLNDGVSHGGSRVHAELELRLLAIVSRKPLKDESTETRTSSTTEGVENEEALETTAVICEAANPIHHIVDLLLANGIVSTGIYTVIGSTSVLM